VFLVDFTVVSSTFCQIDPFPSRFTVFCLFASGLSFMATIRYCITDYNYTQSFMKHFKHSHTFLQRKAYSSYFCTVENVTKIALKVFKLG